MYIYIYIYNTVSSHILREDIATIPHPTIPPNSHKSLTICIYYIYVIMKIMCLPGYHHDRFVAINEPGHMKYIMSQGA